jgi:SET domain-containing protein
MADDPNSSNVFIQESSNRGRGVFARRSIRKGELIERSPVIVIPREQWTTIEQTILSNYVFDWGESEEDAAVALGCVSIYNHSYAPNAELTECLDDAIIEVSALRDIGEGEEILVNYNGSPDDHDELWFDVVEAGPPNKKNSTPSGSDGHANSAHSSSDGHANTRRLHGKDLPTHGSKTRQRKSSNGASERKRSAPGRK